jgi:7-cyano-7-deazaguanine reductase
MIRPLFFATMYEFETFDNPRPGRHFMIESVTHEFTCNCPMTGQPDFASLRFRTVPGEKCVELKSLKQFLWSFRNEGHFHEDVTNRILDEIVAGISPVFLEVRGEFNVRGGISTVITARHGALPLSLADIERSENIF